MKYNKLWLEQQKLKKKLLKKRQGLNLKDKDQRKKYKKIKILFRL